MVTNKKSMTDCELHYKDTRGKVSLWGPKEVAV